MKPSLALFGTRAVVACGVVLLGGHFATAQDAASKKSAVEWITPAAQASIERGLKRLAARQREDGSFGAAAYRGNAAITGLAGMAMLAGGSTPERGPYGAEVGRCVDYLLANTQQSGFITAPAGNTRGPMYGHGFATMFLAESYGMAHRAELREKLTRAVKLIINTQNKEGGWRYQPRRVAVADISVTVCQVMALRAARNAGLFVPNETVDRSIGYVKRCQNADGGFMYKAADGGPSGFGRSAAGVVALNSAGIYKGPEISKGLDYLMGFKPAKRAGHENYYFYGHYYAVQAMWQAGGQRWQDWYPAIRDQLIDRQRPDGSWASARDVDYATAMALIVLQLPEDHLPIFQR